MKQNLKRFTALFLSMLLSANMLGANAFAWEYDDEDCPHTSTAKKLSWREDEDCINPGFAEYEIYCEDCFEVLDTEQEIINPTGHLFSEPAFEWADDYSECWITLECKYCMAYAYEEDCAVKKTVKKKASYAAGGSVEYTASYKFLGKTFKDTKTVKTKKLSLSKVTLKSAASKKNGEIAASWSKNAKATGYQVQYSTDKKFKKGVKTVTISKNATTSTTLKKLDKSKTYYIRVRACVTENKKNYYSGWSNVKSAKAAPASKKPSSSSSNKKPSSGNQEKPSSGFSDSSTVYVSKSGKIHKRSNCSGMKNYTKMTYGKAKSRGYAKCKNCFH